MRREMTRRSLRRRPLSLSAYSPLNTLDSLASLSLSFEARFSDMQAVARDLRV
jgi:hypothetical protein